MRLLQGTAIAFCRQPFYSSWSRKLKQTRHNLTQSKNHNQLFIEILQPRGWIAHVSCDWSLWS